MKPIRFRAVAERALLLGLMAAFIVAVYTLVVAAAGTLFGGQSLPASIAATAAVAVTFRPARERVRRWLNRLLYGERLGPYEVLARFSERVAETYGAQDVLMRMAQVVSEGTRARRVDVWLRVGDVLRVAASWPSGEVDERPLEAPDELPAFAEADRVLPVRHRGELLGALTVVKRRGESVTAAEDRLLADLASQAGLVLRNVRLGAELEARVEEISLRAAGLRASRERIVAAQDAERRLLERNIHDGAQQHLVALAVQVRLAGTLLEKDPGRVALLLADLREMGARALESLRDLTRGIYPSVLAEEGLVAALRGSAELRAEGVGRYAQEIEAAVYFSCLEALQNAAKHAAASHVEIALQEGDGELRFSVTDDGRGFDPDRSARGAGLANIRDRIAAIGGTLEVRSAPGEGTTVAGRMPVRS